MINQVVTNSDKLLDLKQAMLADSQLMNSSLAQTATQLVFGAGSDQAKIMLIGEAPGRQEDAQGRPFVGSAGRILSQCLKAVDLKPEDVWITNLVKYRPPNNRDPLEQEKKLHAPYLEQEIAIIQPNLIVALGRHAGAYFKADLAISRDHGQVSQIKRRSDSNQVFTLNLTIFYHPAAGLYQPQLLETIKQDFINLKQAQYI